MKNNGYRGYLDIKTLICHSLISRMFDNYPSVAVSHTECMSVCVHACSCVLIFEKSQYVGNI